MLVTVKNLQESVHICSLLEMKGSFRPVVNDRIFRRWDEYLLAPQLWEQVMVALAALGNSQWCMSQLQT